MTDNYKHIERITQILSERAEQYLPEWDVDLTKQQRNHIIHWVVVEIFCEVQKIEKTANHN